MKPLKRLQTLFYSALTAISLGLSPAVEATGTTPLSLVQQFDSSGAPLAGCLLYFYVAGTVGTPQNAYADFGLTTPLPNPITCDQSGRVPQHWLADGLIHIRLLDSSGIPQVDTTMQVLGPSSGGSGGGGTVDPTAIMTTGDIKARYSTGTLTGFVRANGLTIGSASSGASERANSDTQNLFVYLYNTDPNLSVVGGRSGNALNDFNANKQLALPDWRGFSIAGLGDMGNSATSVLTSGYFGNNPLLLGAGGGSQSHTLVLGEVPTGIQSGGSLSLSIGNVVTAPVGVTTYSSAGGGAQTWSATSPGNFIVNSTVSAGGTLTSSNTGGTAHSIVGPMKLTTIYMKL